MHLRPPSMRPHKLQCYLATVSIFILGLVHADHGLDLNFASDGAGLPVALDSFNGLELRDSLDENGHSNGLDLVRRYPNDAKSLGNNQFALESLEIGDVLWFYLPKDVVNGPHAAAGVGLPAYVSDNNEDTSSSHELRKRALAERATTTVYLSLTTCSKPHTNKTGAHGDFPQLEVYVSNSKTLEKPGPGKDDDLQDKYTASGGYLGITKDTDSDVFIGVAAPNSTVYTGGYTFQLAASIDEYFHKWVNDTNLFFVDADNSAALLVTNNLTESESNTTNYRQWLNMVPPFTMFAHNLNNTALKGLEQSFCALDSLSQVGRISNITEVGMTSRGLGNKPKEQFYITGLNRSSSYEGLLAMVGNSTASGNGIVGGGGKVWRPMNFTTKADDNCAVLFNLTFCSEVAYAVPSNPDLSVDKLRTIYDSYASKYYRNFNYSLQQVQCKTDDESMFSLAVTCADCDKAYREWLCSVTIPRCADYSATDSYLAVRNAGQDFFNGTSLPSDSPYRKSVASNNSRNPIIDDLVKPGPYKEILPCQDICHTLVKSCPSSLGFSCPEGKWLNSSYGYRNSDGVITCSYLGAVYYLSLGARVGIGAWWAVLVGLVGLLFV